MLLEPGYRMTSYGASAGSLRGIVCAMKESIGRLRNWKARAVKSDGKLPSSLDFRSASQANQCKLLTHPRTTADAIRESRESTLSFISLVLRSVRLSYSYLISLVYTYGDRNLYEYVLTLYGATPFDFP